ncbi:MAG: hypothetical protein BGO26_19625 [Actinobacteria bacterium 69-20]|nr:alpha/beta fold hydrolase [Actinomycetota bacterium]OJV24741.1 MAG: hypothetical protein BGO26_19625 [Actinobacteria bacterium 69-20]
MNRTVSIATKSLVAAAAVILMLPLTVAAEPDSGGVGAIGSESAAPVAVFAPCAAGTPPGAECGTVSVPLDRVKPDGTHLKIAFQFYRATDTKRPAVSTIVPSSGGPGLSNIDVAALWLDILKPLRPTFNVLLIDHRGIGASDAIDCPALQHVQGNQLDAARACGQSLGAASDRYGSGDVADDVDAVRAALNLPKIDYYGVSYGAVDVRAYAYRHADHLRAAVLDSPYDSKDAAFVRTLPGAMIRIAASVCLRSTACASAFPRPEKVLDDLVRQLGRHPVSGVGYDADGNPHKVTLDQAAVLAILYNNYFADPAFLSQGEIFAAAAAFNRGDRTALLRLAAESPVPTDFGPADGLTSVGADYAVFCADSQFPWNKNAPEAVREAQYRAELAHLPAKATAPFAPSMWAGFIASQPTLLIPGADACVPWPAPQRPEPPFPPDEPFPSTVPALLLGGGLDYLDINSERSLMPLFRGDAFVTVQNAGHVTSYWNDCARSIITRFFATLRPGDTRCAANTQGQMANPFGAATGRVQLQGVAAFPATAARAPTPRAMPGSRGSVLDRKIAGVAESAVLDAVYHSARMTGTTGRGLHGGTYRVSHAAGATTFTLQGVRFTEDVAVSGDVRLDSANRLTAALTVVGPRGTRGRFEVHATLWEPDRPWATVTGSVAGRTIRVTAPAR